MLRTLAAIVFSVVAVLPAAAQVPTPMPKPAGVLGALTADPKDDDTKKLKIEWHNTLLEAVQIYDARLAHGVSRDIAQEMTERSRILKKIIEVRIELETDAEKVVKLLEELVENAKKIEKALDERKVVDPNPAPALIAKAERIELQIRIAEFKKGIKK